jgi:hypothetical protein
MHLLAMTPALTGPQFYGYIIGGGIGLIPATYFLWPWVSGASKLRRCIRAAFYSLAVVLSADAGQLVARFLFEKQ